MSEGAYCNATSGELRPPALAGKRRRGYEPFAPGDHGTRTRATPRNKKTPV
jgi:hypothetical protein